MEYVVYGVYVYITHMYMVFGVYVCYEGCLVAGCVCGQVAPGKEKPVMV